MPGSIRFTSRTFRPIEIYIIDEGTLDETVACFKKSTVDMLRASSVLKSWKLKLFVYFFSDQFLGFDSR